MIHELLEAAGINGPVAYKDGTPTTVGGQPIPSEIIEEWKTKMPVRRQQEQEEQEAQQFGKWLERKRRNTSAMVEAPPEMRAALERLNEKCDVEINKRKNK